MDKGRPAVSSNKPAASTRKQLIWFSQNGVNSPNTRYNKFMIAVSSYKLENND